MWELLTVASLEDFLRFIRVHGDAVYLIAFAFAFSRSGFLPPLLAGYAAHHGALDPLGTYLVFGGGSWLGDEFRFLVGRRWGKAIVARVAFLRRPVEVVTRVLDTHPVGFILSYRFARGMRTAAALGLGMTRIPWVRYTPLNLAAAALWAAVFVGGGFALGQVSETVLGDAANALTLALLAVFLLVGWLISRRLPAAR